MTSNEAKNDRGQEGEKQEARTENKKDLAAERFGNVGPILADRLPCSGLVLSVNRTK